MKSLLSLGFVSRVGLTSLVVLGVVAACSAGAPAPQNNRPGAGGSGPGSGGGLNSGGTIGPIDIPDSGASDVRVPDDAGNCINVLVYGRLPTYGADPPGTDTTIAFQTYLNSKSNADVAVITVDTELTPEFLVAYDVIILQALEDRENGPYWTITPQEVANVQAWVEAGGGLMSLTGYGAAAAEVNPTNQLFAFSGLSYGTADIVGGPCPDTCCYCASNSMPAGGWNAAHPIALNVSRVGAFHGRPVMAPADATIVAQEGANVLGATKQIGAGRVFMFFDEWVTYTSQWGQVPTSVDQASCVTDMNNPCHGRTADVYYTVPQFWFNSLLWISGDRECFDIMDPVIVK